jgi:DNA-binding IclR family transcriptional regulator
MLEHSGPDPLLDVLAAAGLEDDGLHAAPVQEVGQHQPGWPGADDGDLRPHRLHPATVLDAAAPGQQGFHDAESGGTVVTAVGKALGILDALEADGARSNLSELAARCGLPLSTAHRLVTELVEWGALERGDDGRYALGLRLWELGALAPRALGLRQCAMPVLEDLYEATHENVQLCVLEGLEVVFIERISGRHAIGVLSRVGGRLPAHVTSGGQVMLAFAPSAIRRKALAGPLPGYTGRSITDPDRLRSVLAAIRRSGFVVCDGHVTLDALAVAAPIRGPGDVVVAAVSVVVPSVPGAEVPLIPAVVAAARGISRSVGAPSAGALSTWWKEA